ncbi:hypothetical protein [Arthrobacter sp. C9C5]|uniref:hypothetical protein n=1 Tax=Arthrobacter sp. C9C5 TaxID=2735267 RepID=UPI001585CA28|nr:hypothetical protein [Arthrobacter sp. C9C5]NUU32674.1 hypothetical protein [Arthrobacter sp. C9C5]
MNDDEGFTPILVPNEYRADVYRFLADLSDRGDLGEHDDPVPTEAQTDARLWPLEKLIQFANDRSKTASIIGEILDILVVRPERRLSIDELAKETERPRSQVKTVWTHLGRTLPARYDTKIWPLTAKWSANIDPRPEGPNLVYYWLTDEQAELWKQARDASTNS